MAIELSPKRRREIALAANCDPIYLHQVLRGIKDAKPRLAHLLVEVSGGEIRLWHVRQSDWFEVWPDLIGKEGAPPPVRPAQQPAASTAEAT